MILIIPIPKVTNSLVNSRALVSKPNIMEKKKTLQFGNFKFYTHLFYVDELRVSIIVMGNWINEFRISRKYETFLKKMETWSTSLKNNEAFNWFPEKLENFNGFKVS